jgi:hypothetical protein
MKIRIGPYTVYNGIPLAIKSVKDDDENILLRYDGFDVPFVGFEKSTHEENVYYLKTTLHDIKQAYWVQTFGIYKGFTFELFPLNIPGKNLITITTSDKSALVKLNLTEVKKSLYATDINPIELEKAWEERRPSGFNLPMPLGISLINEITL